MEQNYKVIYNYTGVCNEAMKGLMASEYMRVYNIYADMCNNGVTDRLNEEFESQNPNYFEDNKGKEYYLFLDEVRRNLRVIYSAYRTNY